MACHQQGRPRDDDLLGSPSLDMKHVDDEDDNLHRSPSPSSEGNSKYPPRICSALASTNFSMWLPRSTQAPESGAWSSPPRMEHDGGPGSGERADGGSVRLCLPNLPLFAPSTPTTHRSSPIPAPASLPVAGGSAQQEVANSERERCATRRSAKVLGRACSNGPGGQGR